LGLSKLCRTDEDCKEYLSEIKWENGYNCIRCRHPASQIRKDFSRTCNKCSHIESASANTLFHKIKFGLLKAFRICCEMSTSTNILSASYVSNRYSVTKGTARIFMRKVRKAMKSSGKNPESGLHTLNIKYKMKVAELFAGVGGFRLGLEKTNYEVVWSNQWEPSSKMQYASMVYEERFGKENHSNEDINEVIKRSVEKVPDHDLLVGGFPCQDYSVATTLNNSKGLEGKKGVLWWSIHRILENKRRKPKYLLLENVDRLLKSPSEERGRDFAVILKSLDDLGYAVEWRVINAADYGMPQRRRRIFFIGYHESTKIYKGIQKSEKANWLTEEGVIANAFPVVKTDSVKEIGLEGDLVEITNNFNKDGKSSPFHNAGLLIAGKVYTTKTNPIYNGLKTVLGDVLQDEKVSPKFFIDEEDKEKWDYLKGEKNIERKSQDGFVYEYSEGRMVYPDALDNASRTIITGEGGKSPSRFKHVIACDGGLRRLTPIELERLNMFPDNHTKLEGVTDVKRAFFMGNALVVGVIEKIGEELYRKVNQFEYT
jgi:DNA (cytosine-5)-methyltransferase 1